jgi:hypothetical protein
VGHPAETREAGTEIECWWWTDPLNPLTTYRVTILTSVLIQTTVRRKYICPTKGSPDLVGPEGKIFREPFILFLFLHSGECGTNLMESP